MLLHRLVGGTTTKLQSFLSYSLESEWCVDELTLAQVTRDQRAGDFQPFATWGDGRAAAHQPCRLQGQEQAGLGVGDWAATGHRQTQTRNSWFNTSATSLRFWMMYPHILWYSWPPSFFSHTTSSLSSGWYCVWFFSFLHPSFFQFMPQFTSAFEGRVGTVLSLYPPLPEISAAAAAEAPLFAWFVPTQGTYTNCTCRGAR